MAEQKRFENALVKTVGAKTLVLDLEGSELDLEFSKFYSGADKEQIQPGGRVSGIIFGDRYVSGIRLQDSGSEQEDRPSGDALSPDLKDTSFRTSAAKIAAMILQTHKEPVYLSTLFSYARWIEQALQLGFERVQADLKRSNGKRRPSAQKAPAGAA